MIGSMDCVSVDSTLTISSYEQDSNTSNVADPEHTCPSVRDSDDAVRPALWIDLNS